MKFRFKREPKKFLVTVNIVSKINYLKMNKLSPLEGMIILNIKKK
jgi:hypothetical protein